MHSDAEGCNEFTYCGDLVGMSSIYASAPGEAYNFLNEFYNTVFDILHVYDQAAKDREVYMFSDSLIVTGDDPQRFVEAMCGVYMRLLSNSLLLRGGVVRGRLRFDPRQTRSNFHKLLPQDNTLARANGLEKSVKGARFVIDADIAGGLIAPMTEWLTLQGYSTNPMRDRDVPLQRSIVPLIHSGAFEILYPVYERPHVDESQLRTIIERLDYLANASPPDVGVHYAATIHLIQHAEMRRSHMPIRRAPLP